MTYIDDTRDHVADERLESGDGAALLGATEPHLDVEVLTLSLLGGLLQEFHLNWHVFEVLGDLALGALDLHLSCLYSHSDYTGLRHSSTYFPRGCGPTPQPR